MKHIGSAKNPKNLKKERNTFRNIIPNAKLTMNSDKTLLDILPHDKQHAITAKEICEVLGLEKDICVREAVNALRRVGKPICANSHGYWLSDKPEEVLETIHSLEHRMVGIAEATEGMYHYLIEEGFVDGKVP